MNGRVKERDGQCAGLFDTRAQWSGQINVDDGLWAIRQPSRNAIKAGRSAHTFNRDEMVGRCLTGCLNSLRLRRDPIAPSTWGTV